MKKPKKHLKMLARLATYLKKEGARIEKISNRSADAEGSVLVDGVLRRLAERREIALVDLGLIDAAEKAARQSAKAERGKKPARKKVAKKSAASARPAPAKAGRKGKAKAPAKKAAASPRRRVKAVAKPEA